MPYVKILINRDEEAALVNIAIKERRYPPQQIAYVLRQWLEREGLLPNAAATGPARPQESRCGQK